MPEFWILNLRRSVKDREYKLLEAIAQDETAGQLFARAGFDNRVLDRRKNLIMKTDHEFRKFLYLQNPNFTLIVAY